jgi:hypothetical protein
MRCNVTSELETNQKVKSILPNSNSSQTRHLLSSCLPVLDPSPETSQQLPRFFLVSQSDIVDAGPDGVDPFIDTLVHHRKQPFQIRLSKCDRLEDRLVCWNSRRGFWVTIRLYETSDDLSITERSRERVCSVVNVTWQPGVDPSQKVAILTIGIVTGVVGSNEFSPSLRMYR